MLTNFEPEAELSAPGVAPPLRVADSASYLAAKAVVARVAARMTDNFLLNIVTP
jgi:hypothetical protein